MPHTFIPTLAISLNEDILFFLVFGVFALIKFLASRSKAKEEASSEVESDVEKARRTREIQEEIRRRIAENQKSAPAPAGPVRQTPPPAPVLRQEPVAKPSAPRPARAAMPPPPPSTMPDIWQQLAEAQRMEEETRRKAAEIRAMKARIPQNAEPIYQNRTPAEQLLRNPSGLRDAIILSELLSPPLSEREEGSCAGLR